MYESSYGAGKREGGSELEVVHFVWQSTFQVQVLWDLRPQLRQTLSARQ